MTSEPDKPILTRAGLLEGARLSAPLLPGVVVFAMAFGAAAAGKGLSLFESALMSALVFAGMAQMVALEAWPEVWSWSVIGSLAVLTAVVNSRMVLQGASLHPWLRSHGHGFNAAQLFLLTDANWLVGSRYHAGGGRDLGVLIGVGLALWVLWLAFTLPGYLLGAMVSDPHRFGLDLVMPVFFAAMLVPLWRGRRAAVPWAVAGAVALLASKLLPGHLFILAGALSGMLTAALVPDAAAPEQSP
ncbi:MAG: AzlC family ABC transporter permease [Bosea sp. (in: a-proteobacteria)]